MCLKPGGYLMERWVRGCVAQIGCFFCLSGFPMAPFLFENWFRYRSHFRKMHNFRWIFPFSLPTGCQKVLMHPNLYGKKYWLVLKRVLQEANGLSYRLQICIFSGFVIGWWLKLRAAHPYPTQSWVPPRGFKQTSLINVSNCHIIWCYMMTSVSNKLPSITYLVATLFTYNYERDKWFSGNIFPDMTVNVNLDAGSFS